MIMMFSYVYKVVEERTEKWKYNTFNMKKYEFNYFSEVIILQR